MSTTVPPRDSLASISALAARLAAHADDALLAEYADDLHEMDATLDSICEEANI